MKKYYRNRRVRSTTFVVHKEQSTVSRAVKRPGWRVIILMQGYQWAGRQAGAPGLACAGEFGQEGPSRASSKFP